MNRDSTPIRMPEFLDKYTTRSCPDCFTKAMQSGAELRPLVLDRARMVAVCPHCKTEYPVLP